MPLRNIDYSKTIIYKIVCNDLNIKDCYVGHTTNFIKRKNEHLRTCNNSNGKCYNLKIYKTIRENGGIDNWSFIMIEKYPCNNGDEARIKERFWYESLNSNLNTYCPGRKDPESKMEYYKANKDKIKKYRDDNEDKIKQYKKNYYESNKEKIAELGKEYREENSIKIKESKKEYYKTNKEKIKETRKDYYLNNKDKISEISKDYYIINKNEVKERVKKYREANKEKIAESKREKCICECGIEICKNKKSRHLKTQRHLKIIESLNKI